MADQGCVILTAQNVTDGTVTVTPAATPQQCTARVCYESQSIAGTRVYEEPRKAEVSGANVVVTLDKRDRSGRKLCWTSYE